MSKSLIYLIAIFCLWMYFKFSSSANAAVAEKPTVKDFDKAQSGHGGTMVSSKGIYVPGGGFTTDRKIASSYAVYR